MLHVKFDTDPPVSLDKTFTGTIRSLSLVQYPFFHCAQIPPVCLYYKADGWSQPQKPSLSINHKHYSSHHLGVEKTLKSFSDLVHSTEHSNCTAIETVR